ncbi:hypothetical protein GGS21DRAFT_488725 [Xylaria nigripes]|nr:hypothetical protein GGS21DRAFT_488725 [Xylaria nigripes]
MSGVRNLRAMFEQKGDGSLPDRGRSPGFATPSPSASPRPLSKVRTSFVAVEREGKIGLRREPSGDSVSASSRRPSNDTNTTTPQQPSDRSEVLPEGLATNIISKMNLAHEPIPESPRGDNPDKPSSKKELQGPLLQPVGNPEKGSENKEYGVKSLTSATESHPVPAGDAPNGTSSNKAPAAMESSAKSTSKTATPVSTKRASSRAPKAPLTTKVPSTKEPMKAPSGKEPAKAPTSPKKASAIKTAASKPAPVDLAHPSTSSVKPKSKSPTRSTKAPSASTSSLIQKPGSGNTVPPTRRSLSRASAAHHLSPNSKVHRSPSRSSASAGGTAAKAAKRKPSSVNTDRPRPSVGPPPKPTVSDQPAKRESHVDEGFLARMMRPTQSSAKKTAEKVPLSPTRKPISQVKRPDTKDAAEKNVKKVITKAQPSSTKTKTSKDSAKSEATKEQSKAKVITSARAGTTKATAEGTAQSSDMAEAEDKKAVEAAQDVPGAVESEETAEVNTEAIKTITEKPSVDSEVDATSLQAADENLLEEITETTEPAASAEQSKADAQMPVDEPVKTESAQPADEPPHVTEGAKREAPAAAQ